MKHETLYDGLMTNAVHSGIIGMRPVLYNKIFDSVIYVKLVIWNALNINIKWKLLYHLSRSIECKFKVSCRNNNLDLIYSRNHHFS